MPTAGECEEAYVLISYWWVMGVERGGVLEVNLSKMSLPEFCSEEMAGTPTLVRPGAEDVDMLRSPRLNECAGAVYSEWDP